MLDNNYQGTQRGSHGSYSQEKDEKTGMYPHLMFTELKIPTCMGKTDPSFLYKFYAHRPMTVIEKEQWFAYDLDKRRKQFFQEVKENGIQGLPKRKDLHNVMFQWQQYKNQAMTSHKACHKGYNQKGIPLGFEAESTFGVERRPVFYFWKQKISEQSFRDKVLKFMDLYDIDYMQYPGNKQDVINMYYQAKYGIWTCSDALHWSGKFPPEWDLVRHWEKDEYQRKYVWNQAVLSSLLSNQVQISDLEPFKRNYKQTKAYNTYTRVNKGYLQEVNDWIEAIELNEKGIKTRVLKKEPEMEKFDPSNVLKQVRFYNENKEKGYQPSKEAERFKDFDSEERIIEQLKAEHEQRMEAKRQENQQEEILTTMDKLPAEVIKEKFDARMIEKRNQKFKKEKLRPQDGA